LAMPKFFRRFIISLSVILIVFGLYHAEAFEIISVNSHSQTASIEVLQIQQRLHDLNYFNYKTTATYGRMSNASIQRFQEVNSLSADGRVGEETYHLLFSNEAKRNPIPVQVSIPFGPTASQPKSDYGQTSDWETHIDMILTEEEEYELTDMHSGKKIKIRRVGGKNHAKIEPASKRDHDIFLEIFGGAYNWSKRPVTILIGDTHYAASLQGYPYGEDKVDANEMTGSCDLYFSNSLSDTSGFIDEEHRNNISRASGRW